MTEDFKVIETQEDFDKAIKERLARKEKEVSETFKLFSKNLLIVLSANSSHCK